MGREGARGYPAGRRGRPWWLIAKQEGGSLEVMAIGLADGERAVPVFSFGEEAELFLRLGVTGDTEPEGIEPEGTEPEGRWLVRETGAGELASLLLGPLSGVGRVALDPLPGKLGGPLVGLLSVRRRTFVERLLVPGPRPREPGRGPRDGGSP